MSKEGLPRLLWKNMTAKNLKFPVREWQGETFEDVPYSDVSKSNTLDLYVPNSGKKSPLLILVHGGGFITNNSRSRQPRLMYEFFRANGYACVSVNYRLADEAKYPAAIEDVKTAVRFLRTHADEYGYDGGKFAIWGESAGGYLAAMTALCGEDHGISALVDFYGIAEMDEMERDFKALKIPRWLVRMANGAYDAERMLTAFLGQPVHSLSEQMLAEINPHSYIGASLKETSLRVYLTHGSADITVPKLQSERLYQAFTDVLGEERAVYRELKGLKHADDRFYTDENLQAVKAFLDETLRAKN